MKLNQLWSKHSAYEQFIQDFKEKRIREFNVRGLQGSAVPFFVSSLLKEKIGISLLLFLAPDYETSLHFFQDMTSFSGLQENKRLYIFPPFEVLPYEDVTRDTHIMEQRINVLSSLAYRQRYPLEKKDYQPTSSPMVILSSYRAILPRIMSFRLFHQHSRELKQQEQLLLEEFLPYLIQQGYQSSHIIEYQGQFSQRGGIIDLFPFTEENPVRIELNGEHVESIRFFDMESQRSIKKIEKILLLPQKELIESASGEKVEASSFFDYLPEETDIFIQQYSDLEKTVRDFETESQNIFQQKQKDNSQKVLPPRHYFLDWDEVEGLVHQKNRLITLEQWERKERIPESRISQYNIETGLAGNYFGQLDLFFSDLRKWQKEKKNILVLTGNKGRALRLAEIFTDRGIQNFQVNSLSDSDIQPGVVCLAYGKVNYGFSIPSLELILVTDQEIFGRERDKTVRTKKYQGKPFYQVDELKVGDYVVHVQHGIGLYAGIQSRNNEGVRKEYLLLKYAADDELYVPIDQLNLVHKYIGVAGKPPKLYRLGGSSWKGVTRRVKVSIQRMAQELFALYKKRKSITGFSFSADSIWQQELEMAFPFEETPDQGKALMDVKRDMESVQPMERLICGDVGYGKTEVAIRAAFKAVMDSKQVAVLAPTTILAQQHWENFSERIRPFPVRVEMLSRFKSKREQQEIITDLQSGKIDIIIGTHRLVQPDIRFHDLGLLVVDEEQRFGVLQKEKIKKIKEQVDSLTLTATPIPRTLHFSLIGVREMSLMNTPPELRLPILTYLREKNERTIEEAIRRELERGGQVYYVYNRVQNIDHIAEKLSRIVPDARIVTAHGQMPEDQLERIMIDFLHRKYDILVCTTIIEIGLDIPNVNTIIVDEAHQFGLAQLYQLRGRVGRADRRAYAYLLYPSKRMLTDNARKRLQAIREFSDLGSGFRLAMRDLEIRGAGNLLGKEQHGFVSEVGFNYYCQLLEDSIKELKQAESGITVEYRRDPEIDIRLDSFIPGYYIPDTDIRIGYYQKLSQVTSEGELHLIRDELRDIYGPCPREVENLLTVIHLKIKLKQQGITCIRITSRKLSLRYEPDSPIAGKLKKFADHHPSIRFHQRGAFEEIELLPEKNHQSESSDDILSRSLSILDEILADAGSLT